MKTMPFYLTTLLAVCGSTSSFGQWVPVSNGLVDSTLHVGDAIVVSLTTDCVTIRPETPAASASGQEITRSQLLQTSM